MIVIKSAREIDLMKKAGSIVASLLTLMEQEAKVGISTKQLDEIAEQFIISQDGTPSFKGYGGFPASICVSVNDTLIHGIPSHYLLKEGDVISIDVGVNYKGYHGDAARTFVIGEDIQNASQLIEVTKASFFKAIELIKPGIHLGDVSHAIQTYVESYGYSVPRDYTGHGIGKNLHEDPMIPNYGIAGIGPILREGMALAIEPMVNMGKMHTKVLSDDWTVKTVDGSLCAHYENTIIITKSGVEILTIN